MSLPLSADTTVFDAQRSTANLVPALGGELGGLGDAIATSGLAGALVPALPPVGIVPSPALDSDSLFPSASQSPVPRAEGSSFDSHGDLTLDSVIGLGGVSTGVSVTEPDGISWVGGEQSPVTPSAVVQPPAQILPPLAPVPVPAIAVAAPDPSASNPSARELPTEGVDVATPNADAASTGEIAPAAAVTVSSPPGDADAEATPPTTATPPSPDSPDAAAAPATSDASPAITPIPDSSPGPAPDLTARSPVANYQGELTDSDDYNPHRYASFKDDYILTVGEDSTIQFDLTSAKFDPYLQLLRVGSDEVFAFDDDSGQLRNSRLSLDVAEGDRFVVRVTSYGQEELGEYRLTLISDGASLVSPDSDLPDSDLPDSNPEIPTTDEPDTSEPDTDEPPLPEPPEPGPDSGETPTTSDTPLVDGNIQPDPEQFRPDSGYGRVDAAAAVAAALNLAQPALNVPFDAVPDLGQDARALDSLQVPEVWSQGFTGSGITVAVIDSGLDISHAEMQDSLWSNPGEIAGDGIDNDQNGYIDDLNGWNFGRGQLNNQVGPGTDSAFQGHGTHVAGIIAGANDGSGNTGVAYDAKIMALRLGDTSSSGIFRNSGKLHHAVRYAVDNGADVINLSLGWSDSPALRSALEYAADNNVVVVAAAGNSGSTLPVNPARYATEWGLSVGAVTASGRLATFSNRAGTNPNLRHVLAPGNRIVSAEPGGGYGSRTGTSMAAPYVSGVVALMLSANPDLTHDQVRDILTGTAVALAT